MKYTVRQGDCMSSIAYENGFYWKTLWNLPENAALKTKRKNPNVLLAGDIVTIPDITIKQEARVSGAKYKFVRKGVPEKLNIKLLDYDHKPRANLDYLLVVDGASQRGKTDANGLVTASIPPNAETGRLIFAEPTHVDNAGKTIPAKPKNLVMTLQLGQINPVSEVSGQKARLANLGFYKGPIDEQLDSKTGQAIRAFQTKQGLPVTGAVDDATRQKLLDIHGH